MKIQVDYFARLRELRGLSSETCITEAPTVGDLYEELNRAHGFGMDREHLRAAVNDDFSSWNRSLCEGDRVVFIPPVAGG